MRRACAPRPFRQSRKLRSSAECEHVAGCCRARNIACDQTGTRHTLGCACATVHACGHAPGVARSRAHRPEPQPQLPSRKMVPALCSAASWSRQPARSETPMPRFLPSGSMSVAAAVAAAAMTAATALARAVAVARAAALSPHELLPALVLLWALRWMSCAAAQGLRLIAGRYTPHSTRAPRCCTVALSRAAWAWPVAALRAYRRVADAPSALGASFWRGARGVTARTRPARPNMGRLRTYSCEMQTRSPVLLMCSRAGRGPNVHRSPTQASESLPWLRPRQPFLPSSQAGSLRRP